MGTATAAHSGTETRTVAVAGNPNSGKTTYFNGLTGSRRRVGNWPGVTVEKKEGTLPATSGGRSASAGGGAAAAAAGEQIHLVDLPGIYSLSATSEDEIIARDFLLTGAPDVVVDIVDATNLERNLYLTLQLIEMGLPVLVVLNMTDLACKRGIDIDPEHLAYHLGCPVVAISATQRDGIRKAEAALREAVAHPARSESEIRYPAEIEELIAAWQPKLERFSSELGVNARWACLSLIDRDPWITSRAVEHDLFSYEALESELKDVEERLGEESDVVLADARYGFIHGVSRDISRQRLSKERVTETVDRVVLNRVLGIPIFLGVMYAVFWLTITVGGAFIDFFDVLFGSLLVDGLGVALAAVGSPQWLIAILAGGVGAGIQTVATFVPIIAMMFLMLSLLEDSGYMSRAAFVMDRFMRLIGLPGKSFVPMMVGFGCTVPAILGTRTLETRKDRFMTIFMSPLMSCGARLPVYALFAAAFFPAMAGAVVFSLYVGGIVLAILTGLLLKHTLFRGSVSHFVMELPPYHVPRPGAIARSTWERLRQFIARAGITITTVVTVLAVLNSIGTDGSFGNQDSEESVLSFVGKSITPAFGPMGIEGENWPATVGIFTGLFAKEAIVGTLSSLYSQNASFVEADRGGKVAAGAAGAGEVAGNGMAAGNGKATVGKAAGAGTGAEAGNAAAAGETAAAEGATERGIDLWAGIRDAAMTVPENLAGIGEGLRDPLGTGIVSSSESLVATELETGSTIFEGMRNNFSAHGAYAYLIFVLVYFPCVAALSTAIREMGAGYGWLLAGYLTVLAWSLATLFFQLSTAPDMAAVTIALLLLLGNGLLLSLIGRSAERRRAVFHGTAGGGV